MKRKTQALFSLLPNQEEMGNKQRDEYGRFLYKYSTPYNLFRADVCKSIETDKGKLSWPHDKSFALCLTHDIDHMKTYWKMVIRRLLNRLSKGDYLRLRGGLSGFLLNDFCQKAFLNTS